MVHTLPDYTTKYKLAKIFGQIDSGELAARIKPINVFDRRGSIIWWDDCQEDVDTWEQTAIGTGSSVALANDKIFYGKNSIKLTCGSDGAKYAAVHRYFPVSVDTRLGVEAIFSLGADMDKVGIFLQIFDGTTSYQAYAGLDVNNSKLQYGNYLALSDVPNGSYAFIEDKVLFYHLKLVIDWEMKKYVRILFAEKQFDMSSYSMKTAVSVQPPFIIIGLRCTGEAASNGITHLGGAILTQNEP